MAKINPLASNPVPLSTGTKDSQSLSMKFGLASGETRTISLSYPKDDLAEGEVTSCMESIIDAGSAFEDAPVAILKAYLTKTEKTTFVDNE